MLIRQFLCRKLLWHTSCNSFAPVRYTQSASQYALDAVSNLEIRLPVPKEKQPSRQPFAKNLFLGVFDHEFMYYPEPQTKERHTRFFEWLQPIEKYMSESMEDPQSVKKEEILSHMRDMGVFRANVSEQHLGLNLNQTEQAKLVEVLSCFPWLGSYMIKNHIAPLQIIDWLATDVQKTKYLPRITTGEFVPTVCFTEPENGLNVNTINTVATATDTDTHWTLNGEKAFVANGHDANLFLVFAECSYSGAYTATNSSTPNSLSVFLVERDFGGITCKDVKNLAGLHNSPACTVSFKDTKVPRENLLGTVMSGKNILIDSLAPGNRNIAPQAVGVLRAFVKLLTRHVLQRKHLDQNLHEYEGVQEVIGKIASILYSMESMLYHTTGMIDTFENQDCALEKAMVETYCANECVACIYEGLRIIGAQSYLRENPYIQIFEDALSYSLFDNSNIDSDTYIALLGIQHTGKHLREHILRIRNPFNFPQHILKWATGKEYRLKLYIADHMHPSLIDGGRVLEDCITKLQNASVHMLQRHGTEISGRQMVLRRLAELATRTFALVTVLSRTSRAYCIGARNSEQDRHVAGSFAILTIDRIKVLAEEIAAEDWNNGNQCHRTVAELVYNKKDYFAEHPLNRTY
ncbi:complex I assembly factor ACAD9, mitochondrial [Linepithema humile]|uniref:complex I assembly factor ACAD9, mitochondrial n=1 Tax=Linepithema humile TaxID=83485 RepID=UPI00062385DF|nr:PREDICTED: acyl-CoA dehydrogenase family member 9, mitochondrial-like [Linepithema humile]